MLWNWGTFVFTVAITFVLSPYVVHSLGNTTYGIWVLLASMVGYLGLLDFGVRGAVTRFVAKLHATAAHREASRLAATATTIFAAAGLVAMLASVVLAILIVHRFEITPAQAASARIVVLLGGLTVAVSLVGGVYGGIVIGLERFDLSGKLEIGIGLVRAAAIYLALRRGFGLVSLAGIQLAVSAARSIGSAWLARRLYPNLRIRLGTWDRAAFHQIFSFSFYSTLLQFSSSLILYSDSVVIGAFMPVGAITFFAIPGNLVDYVRSLVRGISTTLTPRTSALEAEAPTQIGAVVLRASRHATLMIMPIAITFWLRGESFIGLWMGPTYGGPSGAVLRILTLSLAFVAAAHVTQSGLMGISAHGPLVPFYIAEALLNLGLSILWVRRLGLPGVAWGTTIPSLVTSLVVMPWFVRRRLQVPVWRYAWESWGRPLLAMLPFVAATAAIERVWPSQGLVSYFAGIAAALPFAAIGAWFVAMDPVDRELVRRRLRRSPASPSAANRPTLGIVAMVPDIWGGPWMPRHHILTRLAREYPVVWVEPPSGWQGKWASADAWSQGALRGKRLAFRVLPWPPQWLHRERPAFLREGLERLHLRRAVRWLRRQGAREIVLYLWRPEFAHALDQVPHAISCYHVDDEYTFTAAEQPVPAGEARVLARVDQVIVHSPALYEKKGQINRHTLLVPNGVDYAAYATPTPTPHDLARIRHPRIGYVGVIKDQLDLELLVQLATRRPEWQLVLVGPVKAMGEHARHITALERLHNVVFLGPKPVSQLPSYMQHLNVCMLCYRMTGYTKFIYPMKLHEYLATGRPVVGTPIRTLVDFGHVVRLATTVAEWEEAIEDALSAEANSAAQVARRQEVARAFDWNRLTDNVSAVLRERLVRMQPSGDRTAQTLAADPVGESR